MTRTPLRLAGALLLCVGCPSDPDRGEAGQADGFAEIVIADTEAIQ